MIKEASKIVDLAVEFCRNNLDNLMAYGAIFVMFIVIISLVRVSRSKDNEDLDFDEIAYKKEREKGIVPQEELETTEEKVEDEPKSNEFVEVILPALLEKIKAEEDAKVAEDESVTNTEILEFVEVVLPPLTARVDAYEDATDCNADELPEELLEEVTEKMVEEVVAETTLIEEVVEEPVVIEPLEKVAAPKKVSRNTSCLEDIIEGLANLSSDGVKKVEIKIQGAEVKITYGNDTALSITEEVEASSNVGYSNIENYDETDNERATDKQERPKVVEATTRKKFGPDNTNVTRSGRVYSEEELEQQIRD
ncbi:MAG: hypothetical protein IKU53_05380 [Firmicutes bacterium]|nr:hypothetical protein [Bacillota bacterium]